MDSLRWSELPGRFRTLTCREILKTLRQELSREETLVAFGLSVSFCSVCAEWSLRRPDTLLASYRAALQVSVSGSLAEMSKSGSASQEDLLIGTLISNRWLADTLESHDLRPCGRIQRTAAKALLRLLESADSPSEPQPASDHARPVAI